MLEFNLEGTTAAQNSENFAVSVVGIGGSGSNVLDRIALEGMPGAELICLASDIRVLNNSMATQKLQLGAKLTQGHQTLQQIKPECSVPHDRTKQIKSPVIYWTPH